MGEDDQLRRVQHSLTEGDSRKPFDRYDDDDVITLIRDYPLAWITSRATGTLEASVLPLVALVDEAGAVTELIGHLGRTNPLYAALTADPRGAILFSGPQAYVAPEHAGRRDWAPTWNYAQVAIDATIVFVPDETEASIDTMVNAMERDKPAPWTSAELGVRYGSMLTRIIGFRARVTKLTARFKLGQDEQPDTLQAILANHPDAALVDWMRRLNRARM